MLGEQIERQREFEGFGPGDLESLEEGLGLPEILLVLTADDAAFGVSGAAALVPFPLAVLILGVPFSGSNPLALAAGALCAVAVTAFLAASAGLLGGAAARTPAQALAIGYAAAGVPLLAVPATAGAPWSSALAALATVGPRDDSADLLLAGSAIDLALAFVLREIAVAVLRRKWRGA